MKNFLSVVFTFCSLFSSAQVYVGGNSGAGIEMNHNPGGYIREVKSNSEVEIRGSNYLFQDWSTAIKIVFINGSELKEKLVKYNLKTATLEIRMEAYVKGVDAKNIKSFDLVNEFTGGIDTYVNAQEFLIENNKLIGFLKVLTPGNTSLFSMTRLEVVKGAYVTALDAGEKVDQLVKKSKYYFGKGSDLVEVPMNKKKIASHFPGHEREIVAFIKEKDISLHSEGSLRTLITYINEKGF